MKSIHILTPFSRLHNLGALRDMLLAAHKGAQGKLWWYPIYDSRVSCAQLVNDWTRPIFVEPSSDSGDACYQKLNVALDAVIGVAGREDYIGFLCDDDSYDPGLLAAIEQRSEPVVVVSLVPHHHSQAGIVVRDPMLANSETSQVGTVGLASYFVRADAAKRVRFQDLWCADGAFFETLKYRHKQDVVYLPHLFSRWNLLPP